MKTDYKRIRGLLYIGVDETVPCRIEWEVLDGYVITVSTGRKKFHVTRDYYILVDKHWKEHDGLSKNITIDNINSSVEEFRQVYDGSELNYPENYGMYFCYHNVVIELPYIPNDLLLQKTCNSEEDEKRKKLSVFNRLIDTMDDEFVEEPTESEDVSSSDHEQTKITACAEKYAVLAAGVITGAAIGLLIRNRSKKRKQKKQMIQKKKTP